MHFSPEIPKGSVADLLSDYTLDYDYDDPRPAKEHPWWCKCQRVCGDDQRPYTFTMTAEET
jgi:hypothetical protein